MQRLTVFGRLIIIVLIIAGLYGIFRVLQNQGIIGKGDKTAQTETTSSDNAGSQSNAGSASNEEGTGTGTGSDATASTGDAAAPATTASAFTYTPPAPENGKLKGVVEMGASGFNSFIIRVDPQKRWKLEKAEFGNSLVLENMASDDDIRAGLKRYIGSMLDFGVNGKEIHFVVSSGAAKAESTVKITRALKSLNYVVNQVTPEQEGVLGLRSVLPQEYEDKAFVVDIGSGNTKISWKEGGRLQSVETYGSKYFQNNTDDKTVYNEVIDKAKQVPSGKRQTCFIIGGVPFELAKPIRKDKERYTVLNDPDEYKLENAKSKAGLNIYKAIHDATGTNQFIFDWDANFTIGFLLDLPY